MPTIKPLRKKMFGEMLPLVQGFLGTIDKEFGEILIHDVFNRVYGREDKLDIKTRELCTVTMISVLGRLEDLKGHLSVAMNLGWALDEIRDCLLICCIPAGWPTAFDGMRVLENFCKEREITAPTPKDLRSGYHETDWLKRGEEYGRAFLGDLLFDELMSRMSFGGDDFQEFIIISVYGKLLSRSVLDDRTKHLCMIAAFAALKSPVHLKWMISSSLEQGVTEEEIKEVLFYCCIYAGQEATLQALDVYGKCMQSP